MDPIEQYIDYLITEGERYGVHDDAQQQYRDALRVRVYQRIGALMMADMSETDADAFADIVNVEQLGTDSWQQPDPMQLQNFLMSKVPNFEQKLKVGMEQFTQEFFKALKPTA